jgi:hypothetical protein
VQRLVTHNKSYRKHHSCGKFGYKKFSEIKPDPNSEFIKEIKNELKET